MYIKNYVISIDNHTLNKRTNHKYITGYYRRNSDAVPSPFDEANNNNAEGS